MTTDPVQQVRLEAAHWLAALHSGEFDPRRDAEFLEWQRRSPEHARAIAQLTEKLGALRSSPLRELSSQQLRQTLATPSTRRQFLRGTLAVSTTAVALALLSRLGSTGFAWPGDLYTGIGERRTFELPDGSPVTLNAASRISPDFAPQQRRLVLHSGELLVEVHTGPQPLLIEAADACIKAQLNALLVRHEAEGCYVVALGGDVQLRTPSGWSLLKKDHWARSQGRDTWQTGLALGADALWLRGLLQADAQPLHEVIEALRPYRKGIIQLSPKLANLRVSGILPLDDSDHALAMLTSIAPIKLQHLTELWVRIEPA